MAHQFAICVHCRAAVDFRDTLRDRCPECGEVAEWIDDRASLDERVAHLQARDEERKVSDWERTL